MLARRAAGAADEPFLRELYVTTRPDLAGWDEQEREIFVDLQLLARRREWEPRFPDSSDELIEFAGRPIGRVWVAWLADACVLVDLALLPEHRRSGIGTEILAGVIAEADRRGVPLRSTVERTNTASLAFHARLGLLPVAEDEVYVACERPVSPARPPAASG